jgi:hypothetical protein
MNKRSRKEADEKAWTDAVRTGKLVDALARLRNVRAPTVSMRVSTPSKRRAIP